MNKEVVDHGATLTFSAVFEDKSGNSVTPSSAQVHLRYTAISTGVVTKEMLVMTENSGAFSAAWDSSVADGTKFVYWNVRAEGAEKISAFGRIDFDYNLAGLPD